MRLRSRNNPAERPQRRLASRGTVSLDFVANRYSFGSISTSDITALPGWTFSRNSPAYSWDSSNNLILFSNNVPRITNNGLMMETAATNLFLNSTTPANQNISMAATGNYTLSVWGDGSVTAAANTATGTGFGTATAGSPLTYNISATGTVYFTVSGSPTIVQVETTVVATSPISTGGSSAQRVIDLAYIMAPFTTNIFNPMQGTFIIEVNSYVTSDTSGNISGAGGFCSASATLNRLIIFRTDIGTRFQRLSGSYVDSSAAAVLEVGVNNTYVANQNTKLGYSYGGSVVSTASQNIATDFAVTQDPPAPDRMLFGITSPTGGTPLNGFVRKFVYVPWRMSKSELAALCS